MSTRVTGVIGMSNQLLVDPTYTIRGNGYKVEWGKVPLYYKQGSFKVQTNGAVTAGRNELVKLVYALATGGYSILTFATIASGHIAYNATVGTHVAAIQAALDAMSSVGPGNSRVTSGPGGNAEIYIEFIGALGLTDVSAVTADATNLTSGTTATITVSVPVTGVPSPTTITVDALTANVNAGAFLDFGNDATAYVTAPALAGATTIAVSDVDVNIADNAQAWAIGQGPKVLPAGLAVGKAGSTSGKEIYPRVLTSNPAFGLLIEDVIENLRSSGQTGYGVYEGAFVWENRLPDAVANSGTLPSAIKTELGSRFLYKTAENDAETL